VPHVNMHSINGPKWLLLIYPIPVLEWTPSMVCELR
jgi:hypothetical protein